MKEHWSLLERSFSYDNWSLTNEAIWQNLDSMIKGACGSLDGAICTGGGYQSMMVNIGAENSIDIGRRSIDLAEIPSLDNSTALAKNFARIRKSAHKLIVYPGTIYETSDFGTVLKAMNYLPQDYHLVHLGRIAQSHRAARIYMDTKGFGLRDRVHLMGTLPFDQYLHMLSKCDIGIVHLSPTIASNRLSWHNRFSELMSAKVPFVYSRNESLNGFDPVSKSTLEYEWQNPKALAEAILKLADDNPKMPDVTQFEGPYSAGEKRSEFLREYVRSLNVKSVTFLSQMNPCLNFPTVELAKAFVEEDIDVLFFSLVRPQWKSLKHKEYGIKLVTN